MRTYYYQSGGEMFHVNERGEVSRPAIGMPASGQWRITGAIRRNNFGAVVECVPFPQCFAQPREWRYKNGRPRWCLTDIDHGARRVQMSPAVSIAGVSSHA